MHHDDKGHNALLHFVVLKGLITLSVQAASGAVPGLSTHTGVLRDKVEGTQNRLADRGVVVHW